MSSIQYSTQHRAISLARSITLALSCAWAAIACSSNVTDSNIDPSSGAGGTAGGSAAAGAGSAGSSSAGATSASSGTSSGGASGTPGSAGSAGIIGNVGGSASGAAGSGGAVTSAGAGSGAGAAGAGGVGVGGAGGGAAGALNLPPLTVYIAGDSTVSEYRLDPANPKSQAGWGQMLGPHYTSRVKVLNEAVGGRTARRFIQEGSLSAILKVIQPGDYLLVQFGTNDSNTTATYTVDGVTYPYLAAAATDFKIYLQQYIDGALDKKAIPVLVTPPPRNSAYCKGARSLANYGQAMLELGKATGVSVVDLGLKTHAHLSAICPKPTTGAQETFFKSNADGSIDGTHFQENGARVMAGFVADGIGEAKLGLAAYRKP
jgi:lysophospholipase L1-like esterase